MDYKNVFKNTLFQIAIKVATSGTGFISAIIIARYLGVQGFGDYTKITSLVILFYLLVDFGLNAVFLQKEKQGSYFKELFYVRIFFSLFFIIILNTSLFFLSYIDEFNRSFPIYVRFGILIFSFTIPTYSIILSTSAIFQAKTRYDLGVWPNVVGSLAILILVAGAAFLSLPLYFIVFSFVLGGIIKGALSIKNTKQKIFPPIIDRVFVKQLLKESAPLGLMLVFNLIYFRADVFLLSLLSTTKDVGIYGLSYSFFEFLITLPLFLSNSIYPLLLKAQKKLPNFVLLVRNYLFIFIFLSLVLIIVFWFASPLFYFIRKEFLLSMAPFRILLLSLPFFFATNFLQWVLISQKQQKYLMSVYFFSGIANIVLNIIFIPVGSYIASAIITGVSESFVFLMLFYKFLSDRKIYLKAR